MKTVIDPSRGSNDALSPSPSLVCECGCGIYRQRPKRMALDKFMAQKYIHGHFLRDPRNKDGKREETKKAWDAGKFAGRNMDHTLGRMAEMRSKIDRVKSGQLTSERLKGTHGQGRWERGHANHPSAAEWHLRDARGTTHRFRNLCEWARCHEHLFDDSRPDSKQPFWLRISSGITKMMGANGLSCSYKGWVIVGDLEYIRNGVRDPLERDVESLGGRPTES